MADLKYNPLGGSKGRSDIFLVESDVPVIPAGTTAITTNTAMADRALLLELISESDIQFNDDGTVNIIPVNHQDDPTLMTFINATKAGTVGNLAEVLMENGTKVAGNSTGKEYLWVWYGGDVTVGSTVKTKMAIMKGTFSKKTGSFKTKRGEWTNVIIEFNGAIVTKAAGMTIPMVCYDGAIINTTAGGDADTKLNNIPLNKSAIVTYVLATV